MSKHNLKAVLFDLDGTLAHHLPPGGEIFSEYVRSLGYKISAEDKIRAEHWTHFYFASSLQIRQDGESYKNEKDFWVNFAKRRMIALGLPAANALELAPKVSEYLAQNRKQVSRVPEDAFPLLESLKSAGYVLGMVSNREKPFGEQLAELKLDAYFKFALASVEVNSFKPDRVIFEKALELAGTSAAETAYVGDNYFADVVGARRVGIMPILYDPTELFADTGCQSVRSFSELGEMFA